MSWPTGSATRTTRSGGWFWAAKHCGAESTSPTRCSISRSCTISRRRAPPIIWRCPLPARSDRLPGERMIALLNALFDAQAKAIHDHDGEILKFIGDGLLAIFPIETPGGAAEAARHALEASAEALAAVRGLGDELAAV